MEWQKVCYQGCRFQLDNNKEGLLGVLYCLAQYCLNDEQNGVNENDCCCFHYILLSCFRCSRCRMACIRPHPKAIIVVPSSRAI